MTVDEYPSPRMLDSAGRVRRRTALAKDGESFDERCEDVNTKGHCDLYVPSRLTRLLRVVGKRSPMMIDRESDS